MEPDQWARVSELFEAALEKNEPERGKFLEQECAGDESLRQQVEQLLDGEGAASENGFLTTNALGFRQESQKNAQSDMIGKTLGPYQIQRHIGSGGMGNVFLATRKEDFQQRVAIKLLKRGMDSEEILKRFRREIRVLAALGAHPNIARLIDAGTSDDGLPYFVMEYVEGMRINEYCDSHRLGIEARVTLMETVCDAVHFAHQHTIIHRDLKPSNILVSGNGNAKLIDFGIAKLTAPELGVDTAIPTRTEHRAMTPEFASPEQVRGGAITTASDVYSLGVVLYELLSGRRPYRIESATRSAVERAVFDTDIARPSKAVKTHSDLDEGQSEQDLDVISKNRGLNPARLPRALQGDLDNIVMMALRKTPSDRYASAGQLAADLRRYSTGDSVVARPLSYQQKAWRTCQRNPIIASLILSVLLGTVFGLGYLSYLSQQLVQSSAIEAAAQQSGLLYEGHKYYTQVVGDIKRTAPTSAKDLKPPATFTIELFEYINRSGNGTTAQMKSQYPFTSRTRGPLDEFEKTALQHFEQGNSESFYRFEELNGRPAIRYAIAMTMQQSCCDCHNTHPNSTKTDWQPGQVRGLLEVARPLDNDRERITTGFGRSVLWISAIAASVFALTFTTISWSKD